MGARNGWHSIPRARSEYTCRPWSTQVSRWKFSADARPDLCSGQDEPRAGAGTIGTSGTVDAFISAPSTTAPPKNCRKLLNLSVRGASFHQTRTKGKAENEPQPAAKTSRMRWQCSSESWVG